MQQKLLLSKPSLRRLRTLTLASRLLSSRSKKPPSPLPDDPYDPPFSPVPQTLDPPQPKDLPFDFRYSYSETNPSVRPISFREPPRFSPFGPGRLDRKWNGVSAPAREEMDPERVFKERSAVLGEPLSEEEVEELVEKYRHSDCARQINLGTQAYRTSCIPVELRCQESKPTRSKYVPLAQTLAGKGGVTHNMLDDIHNHWRRAEAVRIKCLGVPTLDMDNVCFHLEDKTGGKIIYRKINILVLYRGRNYDPKNRPTVPLMLWKPYAPIYPKLIKNIAEGLTFEETKELRGRGLNSSPILELTKNGIYVYVVDKVREAFKTSEVVRLDCTHVDANDCKKIGVKLRDLVPCVPLLFKKGQIILWRGKENQDSVSCDLASP